MSEEEVVRVLDELKHHLKQRSGPIGEALDKAVDDLIERFELGLDPHNFAVLPAVAKSRANLQSGRESR